MDSIFSYGIPSIKLRDRFHKARTMILRAWQTQKPFAFNGTYTELRYVSLWPHPVQQPHPLVWVPGSGSVETWDLAIDENYCYGHLSFSGLCSAKLIVNGFWKHVAKRCGDTNPHRMAFTQICFVAETDAQAERDYYEAVKYFYSHNPVAPGFVQPPGYQTLRSLRTAMERGTSRGISNGDRQRAASGEMSFWESDEKGFIIAGSPTRVRQPIREFATSLRVRQPIATLQIGNLTEGIAYKKTLNYLVVK